MRESMARKASQAMNGKYLDKNNKEIFLF